MNSTKNKIIPIDKEYTLADKDFIVSKTDKKGLITYANKKFIEISGYSEEELLGQPHNIVRHPDMPKAIFKGLWDTIEKGKDWRAIIKNLCKDGGFYWVDARITPSYKDNVIVGYMSIRCKPNLEQIEEAASLYKKMIATEK